MARRSCAAAVALVLLFGAELQAAPRALWTLPWGEAAGQVGRLPAAEANPEGPMSFALDAKGRVHLLDQVHGRVQIVEHGAVVAVIPLPGDRYQDIALAPDGAIWLLDRLADRRLDRLEPDGAWTASLAVEGGPIREGGAVTALFAQSDGIWLELEHSALVRVADLDGGADRARPVVLGRLSGDRKQRLLVARDGRRGLGLFARPASHPDAPTRVLASLDLPEPLLEVRALESDRRGRVAVALQTAEPPASIDAGIVVHEQVLWFDAAGRQLGATAVVASIAAEEQFRCYRLGPDGRLYQLLLDDGGATLWEVQP